MKRLTGRSRQFLLDYYDVLSLVEPAIPDNPTSVVEGHQIVTIRSLLVWDAESASETNLVDSMQTAAYPDALGFLPKKEPAPDANGSRVYELGSFTEVPGGERGEQDPEP